MYMWSRFSRYLDRINIIKCLPSYFSACSLVVWLMRSWVCSFAICSSKKQSANTRKLHCLCEPVWHNSREINTVPRNLGLNPRSLQLIFSWEKDINWHCWVAQLTGNAQVPCSSTHFWVCHQFSFFLLCMKKWSIIETLAYLESVCHVLTTFIHSFYIFIDILQLLKW